MKTHGFTVVEIIVVTAISSLLLMALLRFLTFGFPLSRITLMQTHSTETARLQLKRLATSLRELRTADTGAYPIVEATPFRIIFYANVDADAATERVRYELLGTNLVRGITKPTGSPLTYDVAQEKAVTVAANIQNGATPVLTYYGGDYPTATQALDATNIAAIRYIQFFLTINSDPTRPQDAIDVRSQVQLRNLKSNLADPN